MRVCDLTTLYLDGSESGVNTYLYEKARFLAGHPDRPRHVLVVPGRRTERRRLLDSTVYSIKSPRAPGKPDHRILTDFGLVREVLRAENPTVVETDCVYFLGRVARRVLTGRVPLVGFYHVHLPTFIARPSAARFGRRGMEWIETAAWRYVRFCTEPLDRIVVSSRDIHDRLAAAGLDRLAWVPLGVNLDLFSPRLRRAGAGGATVILHVGRLSPEKNQADLIDAFRLLDRRREWRLRIVGDGPSRADLERRAAGDERIQFLGLVPYDRALAELYASADLLAQPSPHETFGLTVLEAIASGLPVVAVGQGGPCDLVGPDVGALARPGDPADLAAQIESVAARRPRPHLGAQHAWPRTFERLLEVYEDARATPRVRSARPARLSRPLGVTGPAVARSL